MTSAFRQIPSVDRVLAEPSLAATLASVGRARATQAVRAALDVLRAEVREHGAAALADASATALAQRIVAGLGAAERRGLRVVLNLTGTLVHTNLGRAVLPAAAVAAVQEVAVAPSNLEYDIEAGKRGDRDAHVQALICELTGAEAATVVNNNAAAVLLVLNTLALGKEVTVSRGQLVEIGDAFRIPDIMERSGARLREVGTTNRTHPRDYENAIGEHTGALMEVHTSNYVIEGFTASVPTAELSAIAHAHDLPMVVDLGSGTLLDLRRFGLPREPTVQDALQAGADLVTFSGDKLLGGPQAGIVVGRADLMAKVKRNPLRRALRVDKLRIAALAAVLKLYRNPDALGEHLPTLKALLRPIAHIDAVAQVLMTTLPALLPQDIALAVQDSAAQPGSGSLPGQSVPSRALALTPRDGSGRRLERLEAAMRALPLPVIGRIHDGALLLDLRVLEGPEPLLQALATLRATDAELEP